ncbi:cereblon family protein [Desulfocurvibacter africanus]|uniref:cereblon family protein n=1 Tax=Desulfocurvibacter africanus TaxID=873 RepID=UPI0009DAB140|nr:cereblon family protein [Desulfocurvibacter africanus]
MARLFGSLDINERFFELSEYPLLRGAGEGKSDWQAPAANAESIEDIEPRFLLCKTCLHRVTAENARTEVQGKHVHVFCNPYGLVFEIGCFGAAPGCAPLGLPSLEFTWFPGYEWQVGVCRGCRAHLGWRYIAVHGGEFYGLILANLVGE